MFVLLKFLLFFLRPLVWVVAAMLYALFTRHAKRKKVAFRTALGLLLFFSNPFLIHTVLGAYETEPVQLAATQKFETGILLGGLVAYNPQDDQGYFNNAADRFIQTALLYKQGHINNIIVAAGNGYITKNSFREADFIKQRLVMLGIPADRIYADGESRNTLENAQNAKRILDSLRLVTPCLLISSAMHLPRAQKVFQKVGIATLLYPCDFLSKRTANNIAEDYFVPSPAALLHWGNLLKEWVGILAYATTGKG